MSHRASEGPHRGDTHSRDGGTNKPHHEKHGKCNRLYRERVDDQAVTPHENPMNAEGGERISARYAAEKVPQGTDAKVDQSMERRLAARSSAIIGS